MTTDEKAKAYDEALEIARQIHNGNPSSGTAIVVCEQIFPQLRESEDERIRKELIEYLKAVSEQVGGLSYPKLDRWMAYLEKQGQETNIELVQKSWYMEGYHDREFGKEPMWLITTGEDGPKYELNPKYGKKLVEEQKPAEWSEEDETRLTNTLIMLKEYAIHHYSKDDVEKSVDWLENRVKSLGSQPKQEWSEKDKTIIDGACNALETYGHTKLASMLKSLRPYWKPNNEQMEAFRKYIEYFQERAEAAVGGWDNFNVMICLYEQLKKL